MNFVDWFIIGFFCAWFISGSIINLIIELIKLLPSFPALRHDLRVAVVRRLKKSERFMAWLNKPEKHGKPDSEFIAGQITVYNGWRW